MPSVDNTMSDSVGGRVSGALQPHLRSRIAIQETVAGSDIILIDLPHAGFNINSDKLPIIFRLQARLYVTLVNFMSSPGKLLHAVARFQNGHRSSSWKSWQWV